MFAGVVLGTLVTLSSVGSGAIGIAIPGMYIGTRMGLRLPGALVRTVMGVLLFGVGVSSLWK